MITGETGAGKSTLIRRLLDNIQKPVYGFITEKAPPSHDGYSNIYLHDINRRKSYTEKNRIGICSGPHWKAFPGGFERIVPMLTGIPENSAVIMDELGFLENESPEFCNAVLRIFNGNYNVIAAIKTQDTPFLSVLRSHSRTTIYYLEREKRDEVYKELKKTIVGLFQ